MINHKRREVDEDGIVQPYVKPSKLGGFGLFTKGKPAPIEYKRDATLRNEGFLTVEENVRDCVR